MPLRRDLQLGLAVLVLLHLVTALGAIGLLTRMGPAINRILEENARSINAVNEMLAVLASAPQAVSAVQREHHDRALQTARANVTETGEIAVLQRIETLAPRALEGDLVARVQEVDELRALATLNRHAMDDDDARAQRLGRGGAWAAVFLALATLGVSVLVARRLQRRLLLPLRELQVVLAAHRRGDLFRRCVVADAPRELGEILTSVNGLLDAKPGAGSTRSPTP